MENCNYESKKIGDLQPYPLDRELKEIYVNGSEGFPFICKKCWMEQDEKDTKFYSDCGITIKKISFEPEEDIKNEECNPEEPIKNEEYIPKEPIKNTPKNDVIFTTSNINFFTNCNITSNFIEKILSHDIYNTNNNTSNDIITEKTIPNNNTNDIISPTDFSRDDYMFILQHPSVRKNIEKNRAENKKKLEKEQKEKQKELEKQKQEIEEKQKEMIDLKNKMKEKEEKEKEEFERVRLRDEEWLKEENRKIQIKIDNELLGVKTRKKDNKEKREKIDNEYKAIEDYYGISFGLYGTDKVLQPDENLKHLGNGFIIPSICKKCKIFKAYPNEFVDNKNILNECKEICNDCITKKYQREKECREPHFRICKCGVKYYCPRFENQLIHEATERHKKALGRNKLINGKKYSFIQLRKICIANVDEKGKPLVKGLAKMTKEQMIDKLLEIKDLKIPDDI